MRTSPLVIFALFAAACTTDPGFEYVPAKPKLSENAICVNIPLSLTSSVGWYDDEGVELSTSGILAKGKGPGLHSLCGIKENDRLFNVEQALIFDGEYEKQTKKTRYFVCTGTISRGSKLNHPDATVTIALNGPKQCEEFNGTYGHKNKPKVVDKAPTSPCERYTACVCALYAAKNEASLNKMCQEAKELLAGAKRDDASCNSGLKLMQASATQAYQVPLPDVCK